MRILPTRIHGLLDYLVAALLISAPWVFDLPDGASSYVPVTLGVLTVVYSLITDYEWGAWRVLPMRTHLLLDFLNGLFLAASPWILGFSEVVWKPHYIIGLTELLVTILTVVKLPAKKSTPQSITNH